MIFYHFTCPWRFWGDDWGLLPDVPARDLLPSNTQYDDPNLPTRLREPVVWLTTSMETKPAGRDDTALLCLTVKILAADTGLRDYKKWMGDFNTVLPPDLRKKASKH